MQLEDENSKTNSIIKLNNNNDIKIDNFLKKKDVNVEFFKITNNLINNYAKYKISIKNNENNTKILIRRFSDFNFLYEKLVFSFPHLIIPKLPEKNIYNRILNNEKFYKKRAKELNIFFKELIKTKGIQKIEDFKNFINLTDEQFTELIVKNKDDDLENKFSFKLNIFKNKLKNIFNNQFKNNEKDQSFFLDKNDENNEIYIKINNISKNYPKIVNNIFNYFKNNNSIKDTHYNLYNNNNFNKNEFLKNKVYINDEIKKMKLLSYKILNLEESILRKNRLIKKQEELKNIIINMNPHEVYNLKEYCLELDEKLKNINTHLKKNLEIKYNKYYIKIIDSLNNLNFLDYFKIDNEIFK